MGAHGSPYSRPHLAEKFLDLDNVVQELIPARVRGLMIAQVLLQEELHLRSKEIGGIEGDQGRSGEIRGFCRKKCT